RVGADPDTRRRVVAELEVLGPSAQQRAVTHRGALADLDPPLEHAVMTDFDACAELHLRADDRERPDSNVDAERRLRVHEGGRVHRLDHAGPLPPRAALDIRATSWEPAGRRRG